MNIIISLLILLPFQVFSQENNNDKMHNNLPVEEVIAYGIRPGPELWKVTNGENVLWVLGTLSPLPKKMKWQSSLVEAVLENSQALLLPANANAEIGFFQGLSLATSAIGIKKNPEKKKLKDVVPADVYARWSVLKKKYLGNDKGIEKNRPIFASGKLFEKAILKIGLTYNTKVRKQVHKLAKKNKLEVIRPTIKIDLNKPRAAMKKFKKAEVSDLECFTKTLDRLEVDLNNMRLRANAWANGDIEKIRALKYPNQGASCTSAILNTDIAKDMGMTDMPQRLRKKWLEAAKKALTKNKSTFALLPISSLLGDDNVLEALADEGYEIKVPK